MTEIILPPNTAAKKTAQAEPSTISTRWGYRRKQELLEAIAAGEITAGAACVRYSISPEELFGWQRLYDAHGANGLRATWLQKYRGHGRKPHHRLAKR